MDSNRSFDKPRLEEEVLDTLNLLWTRSLDRRGTDGPPVAAAILAEVTRRTLPSTPDIEIGGSRSATL